MEERNKSSNGKKKKSQRLGFTVGGGDGVGGIVLLGGGLAVAGLITAFSIFKNSNRKKYDGSANPSNKKQDATQGVSYFLQTPSTTLQQNQNSCITSHETSKIAVTLSHSDSPERLSIHSLALGDQAVPISDGDKENPSNFHSENFSNFSAKEFSLPAPDGSSLAKSEEMIKNESGEKKTVEVKKEDGELETKNLAVEENLPIQLAQEEEGEGDEEQGEEENDDGKSSEDVTEDEEEVESWEEESSLEEHSPIQSVEEEEKEDGAGDGEKEGLIMKEGESSSDEWSVEDEGKRENESGEMRKLAVEQNLPTQSVEEEESDDCSKHNIEEEKGSEGKFPVGENAAIKSAEKEREDSHDNNDEDSAEEHVMEKDEESSEGTVSSSNESNVEAIWPAEIIEALSQELKEMNAINKNSGEKTANKTEKYDFLDCKIKHEDKGNKETTENTANVFHQKPAQLVAMINDLTVNDLNRRIWVWSILVLLLLLLLLLLFHIHRTPAAAELVCHDPVMVLPRVE